VTPSPPPPSAGSSACGPAKSSRFTILISTFSAANSVLLTPRVFYAMTNEISSSRNSPKFTRAKPGHAAIIGLGVWSCVLVSAGTLGSFNKAHRRRDFLSVGFSTDSVPRPSFPSAAPRKGSLFLPRSRLSLTPPRLRPRAQPSWATPFFLAFRDPGAIPQ
jgi:hypothetical protein